MTNHKHYDLEKVERDTRAMFASVRAQPLPEGASPVIAWQHSKEAEDVIVAAIRLGLTMDMQGVSFADQGYMLGVVSADIVGGFADQGDISGYLNRLGVSLQGFNVQIKQRLSMAHAGVHDAAMKISKVPSGRA